MNQFMIMHSRIGDEVALGIIQIGDYVESFESDLSYWSAGEYAKQWAAAIRGLVHVGRAVLVTSMVEPSNSNFIRCWVIYALGDVAAFQEHIIFTENLSATFDPWHAERSVSNRRTCTVDGDQISEWQCLVSDVLAFASSPPRPDRGS